MGCAKSKAIIPKPVETKELKDEIKDFNEEIVEPEQIERDEKDITKTEEQIEYTPVRKELDVKPPPVKAIPKVTPKSIPKKGA